MDSFFILCNHIKLSQCLFLCLVHSVALHMHVQQQTKEWKLVMLGIIFHVFLIQHRVVRQLH